VGEILPAILFSVCVGTVYVIAADGVLLLLRRRTMKALSIGHRIALALGALGLLCIAYGYLIEPNWLDITHIEIPTSKIAAGKRPIRIAQFSDLHSERSPRLEPKVLEAISAEHPDIIVFTGDSLNSADALPVLRETISAAVKIAPTFVVRGNWDTDDWSNLDLFGGTGGIELNGEAVRMEIGGTPIWIAGLAFNNGRALKRTVQDIPPAEFSVLLYHSPDLMPEVARERIDLFCAGHTHGGQVALPFYGAVVTMSRFGKRYEAGLYHENNTWLYVNRGIGMAGSLNPRVRFWSRPELTVIDIIPAGGG
jgi:predicted MPP superfamily phosphohydrolase